MKIKYGVISVILLLFSACASAAEQTTRLAPGAEPAKYRTFMFVQADQKEKGVLADPLVQRRLQQMVTTQLADKGYMPSPAGQRAELGVNITGEVVSKQRTLIVGGQGPYDERRGRVEVGGYQTTDYREGTLHVEIIDLAQSRLLWSAHILETLSAGYSDDNWKRIARALGNAFKSLPTRR